MSIKLAGMAQFVFMLQNFRYGSTVSIDAPLFFQCIVGLF